MILFLKRHPKITATTLLFVGVALMVVGVFRGEVLVVFNKATRICLECIGIG